MAKPKEVVPVSEVPAYLSTVAPDAEDNFGSEDIVVPVIKLLQGVSPQITEFPEATVGDFWHTGLDISLGQSFSFVVCARRKKYLLIAPMGDKQGILARADDAMNWDAVGEWEVNIDKRTTVTWTIKDKKVSKSGLTEWGTSFPGDPNSPPAATLFYEYLVLLPEHLEVGPCILSLARSQIVPAKKGLNTKISMHHAMGRPLQSIVFIAHSVPRLNTDGQEFRNFTFASAGFAEEELYHNALGVRDTLPFESIALNEEVGALDEDTVDDDDESY